MVSMFPEGYVLSGLAVRSRKFSIELLNVEASERSAGWTVYEGLYMVIVDCRDKAQVQSINQDEPAVAIHAISH